MLAYLMQSPVMMNYMASLTMACTLSVGYLYKDPEM